MPGLRDAASRAQEYLTDPTLLLSVMSPPSAATPDELSVLTSLDAERLLLLDQLAWLRQGFQDTIDASADSNADDEHDPEGSTIAFERSQLNTLVQQGEHQLDEIDAARMRVVSGRYGLCETCGRPISAARLEARPVARTCIECAERSRAGGRYLQRTDPPSGQ